MLKSLIPYSMTTNKSKSGANLCTCSKPPECRAESVSNCVAYGSTWNQTSDHADGRIGDQLNEPKLNGFLVAACGVSIVRPIFKIRLLKAITEWVKFAPWIVL